MEPSDRDNIVKILSANILRYETYPGGFSILTNFGDVFVSVADHTPTLTIQYRESPDSQRVECYLRHDEPGHDQLMRMYDLSQERWEKDAAELNALLELLK